MQDSQKISELIRKDDEVLYGDSGYLGAAGHEAIKTDENLSKIEFRINKRPSSIKAKDCYKGKNWDKYMEWRKSSVRSKVEHPFLITSRETDTSANCRITVPEYAQRRGEKSLKVSFG